MLSAWLATLHKDKVHRATTWDNSATTRLEWDGLGLLIRPFLFGSNLPTGQEGSRASMVPRLRGLVCVPLEVGTIVALPESLAVTPYQRDPL